MSEEVSCFRDGGNSAKTCQRVRKGTLMYKSIVSFFVLFRFHVIGWFLLQGCISYLDFVQVILFRFVFSVKRTTVGQQRQPWLWRIERLVSSLISLFANSSQCTVQHVSVSHLFTELHSTENDLLMLLLYRKYSTVKFMLSCKTWQNIM